MLEEALKKATSFSTADDMYNISQFESQSETSNPSPASLTNSDPTPTKNDTLYFEFSFPYRELYLLTTDCKEQADIWFSGWIRKIDGSVLSCKIGKNMPSNEVKYCLWNCLCASNSTSSRSF